MDGGDHGQCLFALLIPMLHCATTKIVEIDWNSIGFDRILTSLDEVCK